MFIISNIIAPVYYHKYLISTKLNWYVCTEAAFMAVFTTDLILKVITDRLIFSPNAVLKLVWEVLEFFVWITILCNFIQELIWGAQSAKIMSAFKAFRVLRVFAINPRPKIYSTMLSSKVYGNYFCCFSCIFNFIPIYSLRTERF